MPPSHAIVLSLVLVLLASPMVRAQQAGDPERGKAVFRRSCVNCHGWAADGRTGIGLKDPAGPSLRETALDAAALAETIQCGRPGTMMPYHDRAAYRDDRCYGMVAADFAPGSPPARGKTFSSEDVAHVVAYLETRVIGRGRPTFDECIDFFDNPAAKACVSLK